MTETVAEFLDRMRCAWDAGDADAYGALFAEDATYVIFLGDVLLGREAIVRTHRDVFTKWQRGTRMVIEAVDVRPLGPGSDDRVVVTAGGIGTEAPIGYDKLQTFVLRSREGRYECAAFQNTEMSERSRQAWTRS